MRILFATDGSADATIAAEWIRHMPFPTDARYRVISVVAPPALPALPDLEHGVRQTAVRAAQGAVAEARALLPSSDASDDGVLEGAARDTIVRTAADWAADLVVVGARGLGAVKEFLLGGVSHGVARHAPCPVLVCRGAPRQVRVITIAHDGSPGAAGALKLVSGLRLPHHAHLRVVGVADPVRYPATAPGILGAALHHAIAQVEGERKAALEKQLQPAVNELWNRVATVDMSVVVGSPAWEILRYADVTETDLLVMGARGMGTMERLLLGSVSESVLRQASIPVLIARERA